MPQHHDKSLTHRMGDNPEFRQALNKARRALRKENKMQTIDNNTNTHSEATRPVQMRSGQMAELKSEIRSAVNEAMGDEFSQLNAKIESETSKSSLEDKLNEGRPIARAGTWVKRKVPFGEDIADGAYLGVKLYVGYVVGRAVYTGVKALVTGDPSEAVEAVVEAAVE